MLCRPSRERDGGREEGAREEVQGGRRGVRRPLGQEEADQVLLREELS